MEKKQTLKLYGFKLKGADIVNIFNDSHLYGYEKDKDGRWISNGFGWLVPSASYVIDSFYDFFCSARWEYLSAEEFADIVESDEDLRAFDCVLLPREYPIEKLCGKVVEYADINEMEDLDKYAVGTTFTDMATVGQYNEPMYYRMDEMLILFEEGEGVGHYRIIR